MLQFSPLLLLEILLLLLQFHGFSKSLLHQLLLLLLFLGLFFLYLSINLVWRPKREGYFEFAHIFTLSDRVNRQVLISYDHRIHAVLICQEVQTEYLVICGLHRIAETS